MDRLLRRSESNAMRHKSESDSGGRGVMSATQESRSGVVAGT
jgi:hypothetical protein